VPGDFMKKVFGLDDLGGGSTHWRAECKRGGFVPGKECKEYHCKDGSLKGGKERGTRNERAYTREKVKQSNESLPEKRRYSEMQQPRKKGGGAIITKKRVGFEGIKEVIDTKKKKVGGRGGVLGWCGAGLGRGGGSPNLNRGGFCMKGGKQNVKNATRNKGRMGMKWFLNGTRGFKVKST